MPIPQDRKIRVLHLSGSKHHWSGNEQQLADLMESFPESSVENFVFCYEGSAIESHCKKHVIHCFPQRVRSQWSPKLAAALKQCIRANNIDVLHGHTSNFLSMYMVARRLYRVSQPFVFSRKGHTKPANFFRKLKYNDRGIGGYICVSEAIKEDFKQQIKPYNYSKLHVIYDGINLKRANPQPRESLRDRYGITQRYLIGNIANHVEDKDLPTLIRAMGHLKHNLGRSDIHLVQMGGFWDVTPQLEQMIRDLDLSDVVTLMDKVPQASNYLPQLNAFVMSSQKEGLPLTIYEAFYNKIPVVTTAAGGIAEVVKEGVTGLITEIGDYKGLADRINLLLSDEYSEQKVRITEQAYALLIGGFTSQHCAAKTLALYKSLL